MLQFSHPYMTTGKTIALIRWTFVNNIMSLLFKMLCRLAIAFLRRSKSLLISSLQSPPAVILEPPKIRSLTVSIVSPSICHRKSVLNIHWKDWCWSWNSNTLATWCEELIHLKRPWCWERLKGGEGDDRGWDDWMASLTQWAWVRVNSRICWWTGSPGCSPWGCKESDTTEWLKWTEVNWWDWMPQS